MIRDILVKVAADVSDFTKKVTGASKTANDFGRDMAKASAAVTSAVKGVNDAAGTTSDAMKDLGDTVGDTTKSFEDVTKSHKEMMRNFRNTPEYKEYRAMNNELKMMRMQMELVNMRGMMPFQKQMIGVEKQIFGLAQSMGSYTKSNRDFMDEVTALGAAHKKATDQMINNDRMLGASIIRQAGYFRNMTTQAQRITETYDRMGNALYSVNKPGLSVANTLNKIANNGQASVVALRMLGPNASMKQLRDMTMQINQGLMRFQQVALAAAVAGGVLYYALARAAHGPDPSKVYEQQAEALAEYAKAVEDRTHEIMNTWDTFANIQLDRTDGAQLTKNLEEQVDILRDWRKNLASIAERAGDDFATNLSEMGPDAAKHIAEIAEMSDPELDNYVKLFNEKFKLAREQAETELEAMKRATDKKIKELADTLTPLGLAWAEFKGVWAEALQPMVESFGMVATAVVKAATAVGELIVAFNNANPVLGQLLQSVVMLVPILTLLLSPLAIGIGLINGYSAAFGFLWMIIGPLVTGLAAMSATVWLVAAAIVAVTALGIYLYRNWDQLIAQATEFGRNLAALAQYFWGVIEEGDELNDFFTHLPESWKGFAARTAIVIDTVRTAILDFVNMVVTQTPKVAAALLAMLPEPVQAVIQSGIEALIGFVERLKTVFNDVIAGDFSSLGQLVADIIPTIVAALIGGLPGLLIAGARFLPAISEGITSNINLIAEKANEILTLFLTALTTYLPIVLQAGVQLIQTILNGIVTALPLVIEAITTLITFILTTLVENLPMILEAGVTILTTLLTGLVSALPVIIEVITTLISTITLAIAALLPLIVQAGVELLVALINGIIQALPQIIETIVSLITTLISTIVELLPIIIEAGIEIVMALINGIVEALPQIIDAIVMLITSLLTVIVEQLPAIIDAGVQILLALLQGIIDALPQLIDAALLLITSIITTLIQNLPKILEAGVQLLLALIKGIIQIIPQLIGAIIEIAGVIIETLIDFVPKLLSMGVDLIVALIDGLLSMIGDVGGAMIDIGGEILDGIGNVVGDMVSIGADIVNGLIKGIQSIDLGSVVAGLASKIPDWVAKPLGIRSPSRVMRDAVGQWIPAGIGVGIENGTNSVMNAAKRMAEDITRAATPTMPSIASPDVRGFERSINGQMRMSAAQISGNMAFEGSAPVVNVDVRNDWDGNQVRTKVNTDNAWDRRKSQRYL